MTTVDTSKRQPILFASWNFPPRRGGIEEMVRQLFEHLREGRDVLLCTGRHPAAPQLPGVIRSPLPGLLGFLLWLPWRVLRASIGSGTRHLLSSGALVGSLVEALARLLRRPHAVLVYGTDVTYGARLYQCWLRWVLPGVPRLLAISSAVDVELQERGLARSERIERLTPGVDPRWLEAPFDRALQPPDRPVILFVGRVIERKGLEPFVRECLPRILERYDAELWVVGGEPVDSLAHSTGSLARLRGHLATSELGAHVRLFGAVPDATLRAIYRLARVLVLPAVRIPGDIEGFGMVFLEAALFGVPSVATRIGGIPDAVVHAETGLLVSPGDWPALADALIAVLENDELQRRLGENARSRALHDFAWSSIAERCGKLVEEARR